MTAPIDLSKIKREHDDECYAVWQGNELVREACTKECRARWAKKLKEKK